MLKPPSGMGRLLWYTTNRLIIIIDIIIIMMFIINYSYGCYDYYYEVHRAPTSAMVTSRGGLRTLG